MTPVVQPTGTVAVPIDTTVRPLQFRLCEFSPAGCRPRAYQRICLKTTISDSSGSDRVRGESVMSQDAELVLTPRGREKLETRLDHLQKVQRREVAERIRDSKQFGD